MKRNALRYDRSTAAGRYDSTMREVPWMWGVVPDFYIDFQDFGVTVHGKLLSADNGSVMPIFDPTVYPDTAV